MLHDLVFEVPQKSNGLLCSLQADPFETVLEAWSAPVGLIVEATVFPIVSTRQLRQRPGS